jgi:hypothetical protein
MLNSRIGGLLVMTSLLALAGGCVTVPKPSAINVPHVPENSTYLVHISGVSGVTIFDVWWLNQLKCAGATDRWEVYEWVGDRGIFQALREIDENHRIAGDVANYLTALHHANPRARIILSSESAGTAIAVWALEKLPPDVRVETVLLVAPDISPGYDLSPALAHVDRHLFYTTSVFDFGTLGVWSTILGNMDGVKSAGAGFVGFHPPAGADAAAYQRIVRVPWKLTDIFTAHFGNHSGPMAMLYARNVLGPILVDDAKSATREKVFINH